MSRSLRLNRVIAPDGKTLIVAMDHGIALGVVKGLEKIVDVIVDVWKGGADAVMLNLGMLKNVGNYIPKGLGVIASIGVVNPLTSYRNIVETAIRLGADCIKIMFFAETENDNDNIHRLLELSSICSEWNIPLMVEVYPKKNPYNPDTIAHYVRRCNEVGADLIKTFYTGSKETFRYITSISMVPIVILGGPKIEREEELLSMVRDAIEAGAIGIAFGRNIWQHPQPQKITNALKMVIHENRPVDEVVKILKGD
ncbi:MAG TPA: hypothetical protein ENF93_01670 [Ignisphaera sp.]|nr:hypothetical protein [Ignisphaera sp.]